MSDRLRDMEAELYRLLNPEVREIVTIIRDPNQESYLVTLPDPDTVDAPLEDLAALVAKTSNAYGRLARFAGMAKANYKLAKGRYDRKYKQNRVGNNEHAREKAAMLACEDEHIEMTVAESIADFADTMEDAARVASESARKMYDKASSMNFAQRREDHGILRDRDFMPY